MVCWQKRRPECEFILKFKALKSGVGKWFEKKGTGLAYCKDNERITVAISPFVCGVKTVIYFCEISEQQNLTIGNH